ncbi:MAG: CCA tRNA nucleotidyltransferase [Planctomycetaceae bacterium]|nr:CCA tRNA nucleotidyltransferase [Planctomycetaceae bacterium]
MSPRELATDVVRRLRAAGYEALWAGGCVRDQILGIPPKDYDVATSALPEQVRDVFGKRKTLAIGQSFGVITVLGPKGAGQIDVATFRSDATYSDGRHPDSVSFTTAEQDALRRDFTINGLFFDPVESRVIDYVGGQEDLRAGIVRAIGDPRQRIAEDKLRMLRAVRFAARFEFALDQRTLAAIQQQAHELVIVSAERIAAEMRQIKMHKNRARGMQMLHAARLLEVVLPEALALSPDDPWSPESVADTPWRRTLHILHRLDQPTFAVALAALLREIEIADPTIVDLPRRVYDRWKLKNDELDGVVKVLAEEPLIRRASRLPWPRLQRILIAPRCDELLSYCQAVAAVLDTSTAEIDFCRQKLALPAAELNPPPLITGEDLKPLGIPPGPAYRELLEAVRDAQLEKRIGTRDEALELAKANWRHSGTC